MGKFFICYLLLLWWVGLICWDDFDWVVIFWANFFCWKGPKIVLIGTKNNMSGGQLTFIAILAFFFFLSKQGPRPPLVPKWLCLYSSSCSKLEFAIKWEDTRTLNLYELNKPSSPFLFRIEIGYLSIIV